MFLFLSNLFVPYPLKEQRQPIKLYVDIGHAFILVKKESSVLTQLKTNLLETLSLTDSHQKNNQPNISGDTDKNEAVINIPDLNPFVKITYNGETKQTPIVHGTNKPVWNHTIEFNHKYPPLVRMFRIELCSQDDGGNEKVLASEFLTVR